MTVTFRPRERFERTIRIVVVEDVPADAELMLRALRRAGLSVEHRIVVSEPEFREALTAFRPDVVLADSKLPRFSGCRALRIARDHDALLPVIMVTGTLREDRIVRLTQLGLANYVLKEHLLRLAPAVLDALDRADARRDAVQSHAALAAGERRFRAVAEASGDALVIVDQDGLVVFWNAAAERMFGCSASEVLGTPITRFMPERLRDRHERGRDRAVGQDTPPRPFTAEVRGLRKDGEEFPAELTVSAWEEDGRWFHSAQVRDITVRKEEVRTRMILSEVTEQTTSSVVITDMDGAIQYVNPAFERLTGYAAHEVLGQTPRVLKSGKQGPELYERLWAEITAGRPYFAEMTNRRKDGTEYHQRTTVFPILGEGGRVERFVGLGQDVTQERLLESQLRQSQKLEAVGQLAGGVAHDFNNVLTGVLTNAQLLEMTLPDGASEERELLQDVVAAARRGADLVKRLMSLVRSHSGAAQQVDVRTVVDEASRTVRRILPENIEITVDQTRGPLTCLLDEGELQQAIFNLANNARDAMPDGGLLSIRTLAADGKAVIDVRDNGTGMEQAVLDRIFEPFFTTKEVGKGTGLGLAMVYAFAKRTGGAVSAESRPGVGTSVRIAIPVARVGVDGAEDQNVSPTPQVPGSAQGTVLLAEDQDDIRRIAAKVLERMGYRVLTAADGVEALAILGRERGRVDLVLADVVMPRGGGGMLYRNTREWPDQPRFLLMSGYAAREMNGDGELLETVPFLPKPWTIEDLQSAVARIMEGRVA
ncbi:MAG TPA: PAS domain S-box protein [Longimicrobiales bacterium]|nr:PAS domain S-box protein [Longimicrobiales bacterium]